MTARSLGIGFVIFTFVVFVILANATESYEASLILTPIIVGACIYALYRHLRKKELRVRLNRFEPVHVIGMHPQTGEPPLLRRFTESGDPCDVNWFEQNCIIVPHKNVHKEVKRIKKELKEAKNRHGVEVYGYTFQEPIDVDTANETWEAHLADGVINENSYPARVEWSLMKVRASVRHNQYKNGKDQYRKVVMGQTIDL